MAMQCVLPEEAALLCVVTRAREAGDTDMLQGYSFGLMALLEVRMRLCGCMLACACACVYGCACVFEIRLPRNLA